MTAKILLVENELTLSDLLAFNLRRAGFTIIQAVNGASALAEFALAQPDLIILTLNLPDVDGIEVLKRIRIEADVPIIVLTVRSTNEDVVSALESGADDYVTKPFNPLQMVARVRATLRRTSGKPENMYHVGSLSLDLELDEVHFGDKPSIHLTPLETSLLRVLMLTPGRVLTTESLIAHVCGAKGATHDTLKQLIYRLRKKIESNPKAPVVIETIPYIGYKLNPPEEGIRDEAA